MLAKVADRSRVGVQPLDPNGLELPTYLTPYGKDPALRRDSKVEVDGVEAEDLDSRPLSVGVVKFGRKGLVEGVGRDVLGMRKDGETFPPTPFPGEKREGTVPARARRCWVPCASSSLGGTRSGKPS